MAEEGGQEGVDTRERWEVEESHLALRRPPGEREPRGVRGG